MYTQVTKGAPKLEFDTLIEAMTLLQFKLSVDEITQYLIKFKQIQDLIDNANNGDFDLVNFTHFVHVVRSCPVNDARKLLFYTSDSLCKNTLSKEKVLKNLVVLEMS